uniref:Phosphodiesterase n=1 Tax=Tetraselmis sp. GSL018 TaxID=582737 RepID=A0A061RJ86_9CHLO
MAAVHSSQSEGPEEEESYAAWFSGQLAGMEFGAPFLTGEMRFDENLVRDWSRVDFQFHVDRITNGTLELVTIWDGGPLKDVNLLWRDGTSLPSVPWDGRSTNGTASDKGGANLVVVIGSCSGVVAALLVAVLLSQNCVLKRVLPVKNEVEYSTPVMEAVAVLQEASKSMVLWKRTRTRMRQAAYNLVAAPDIYAPQIEIHMGENVENIANTEQMLQAHQLVLEQTLAGRQVFIDRTKSIRKVSVEDACSTSSGVTQSELLDSITEENKQFLRDAGTNLFFDTFNLQEISEGRPLQVASLKIMDQYDLFASLNLSRASFARFAAEVEAGYQDQPYHNATHAADVLLRLSAVLHTDQLLNTPHTASRCYLLAVILAAMVHDYGHPGLNNDFQVATDSLTSRRFNEQIVLENHSAYQTLEMIRDSEFNFMKSVPESLRRQIMTTVIQLVLATDMKKHFTLLSEFQTRVVSMRKNEGSSHFAFGNPTSGAAEMHMSSSSGSAFGRITFKRGNKEVSSSSGPHPPSGLPSEPLPSNDFANWSEELKLLTLQLAIKTADIGHSFALWTDHTKWSEALQDEFFAQGRKEIAMGLPPSKLMDPNKPGVMDPMNQMAFFNVIAVPLAQAWQACSLARAPCSWIRGAATSRGGRRWFSSSSPPRLRCRRLRGATPGGRLT